MRNTLSQNLAFYRAKRSWKQHDLAAEARRSVEWVRGYEQKKRWPNAEELELLAASLGVRPVDLLLERREMGKPSATAAADAAIKAIRALEERIQELESQRAIKIKRVPPRSARAEALALLARLEAAIPSWEDTEAQSLLPTLEALAADKPTSARERPEPVQAKEPAKKKR